VNELNSVKSLAIFEKDDLVKKEMRKLLQANPEGIGSEDFVKKIQDTVKVSRGKVFSMIKKFEESGNMRIERGTDRRRAMYLPNLQKVKTEQRLSEGVEFATKLLSEPNIRFGEGETKSSGILSRVSIFTNSNDATSDSLENQARTVAKLFSSNYDNLLTRDRKLRPSVKCAFIITMET
jgi:hypothetical protein